MQNMELILSMVATIMGFIMSTVTFLVKYLKTHSAKQAAEDLIAIKEVIFGFIEEAEQFLDSSGEQKKAYVMEKIREYACKKNISYDESAIGNQIDAILAFTKSVNRPKTAEV